MDVSRAGFRVFQFPLSFLCCQGIRVFIVGSHVSLSLHWGDESNSSSIIGQKTCSASFGSQIRLVSGF